MQITENSWGWLYLCFKRSHIKEGYFGAGFVGLFFFFLLLVEDKAKKVFYYSPRHRSAVSVHKKSNTFSSSYNIFVWQKSGLYTNTFKNYSALFFQHTHDILTQVEINPRVKDTVWDSPKDNVSM